MVAQLSKMGQRSFTASDDGTKKNMGSSFYRGETINYNPYVEEYDKDDFLRNYVLKGWLPNGPVISRGTKITAFGSCFAAHITQHLSKIGFDLSRDRDSGIYISSMGEGLVNTHALLGQFEWALLDKRQPENLWHGFKAEGYGYDEEIRQRTRKVFLETEFFIITLGLSEVWYDEDTGGVFWRAVPLRSFDAARHKFRVSTFAETKANLARIYGLIRQFAPSAKVLFTLSPIPLAATFRPVSCLTANSASKAILRAALDEMLREHGADLNTRLFYFPSYEIAQELFPRRFREDGRHPAHGIVATIMKTFESVYCQGGTTLAESEAEFRAVRARNLKLLEQEAEEWSSAGGESSDRGKRREQKQAEREDRREKRRAHKRSLRDESDVQTKNARAES